MLSLIVGDRGQDGSLLSQKLVLENEDYIGISRKFLTYFINGIYKIENRDNLLITYEFVKLLFDNFSFNNIYYFAAIHNSSEESDIYKQNSELMKKINVDGFMNILKVCDSNNFGGSIFYASSCLIYDLSKSESINEKSLFSPNCIYSENKIEAMIKSKDRYPNLNIIYGILFNHESIYRPNSFLSSKIMRLGRDIYLKKENRNIKIFNPENIYDFSLAQNVVNIIYRCMKLKIKGNLIIGSGENTTIKDFYLELNLILENKLEKYIDVEYDSANLRKSWSNIHKLKSYLNIKLPSIKDKVRYLFLSYIHNDLLVDK